MTRTALLSCLLFVSSPLMLVSAQVVGAYSNLAPSQPQVVAAARFALSVQNARSARKYNLLGITRAQRQIVSGTNFRLCLRLKMGDESRIAEAVVYQNPQGRRSLSLWTWNRCSIR